MKQPAKVPKIYRNLFIAVSVVFVLISCNGNPNDRQIAIISPTNVLSPIYTLFGKFKRGEGQLFVQLNGGNFWPLPKNKDHSFLTNVTLRAGENEILLELRDGDVILSRLKKRFFYKTRCLLLSVFRRIQLAPVLVKNLL